MKDRRSQRGVGSGMLQHFEEILGLARAARGDHRNMRGIAHGCCERTVEAGLNAVGVHRREKNFACSKLLPARGPLDGVDSFIMAAAFGEDVPAAGKSTPGVDSKNDCLRSELFAQRRDQIRIAHGSCVDAHLIGTGLVPRAASFLPKATKRRAADLWAAFAESADPQGLTDIYGIQAQAAGEEIALAEILVEKGGDGNLEEARRLLDRRASETPLFVRSRYRLASACAR